MAHLSIQNAYRLFPTPEGGRITALDYINLDVAEGEFVTLLGPSGCGKTTLLRAINGFETLDSGNILLDGIDITNQSANKRAVNTVFQSYALFSHMSVARNVGYALEIRGVDRHERDEKVAKILEIVGLGQMGARKPSQLSGGQQQRVALARAIIAEPKLLLLDEPLSALDRNLRQQMQYELKALQHKLGIAFIFVTHDQEEAMTMSDRIAVLRSGRIEQIGTPKEIFRHPRNRFVAEFIGETNLFPAEIRGQKAIIDDALSINLPKGVHLPKNSNDGRGKYLISLRPSDLNLGGGKNSINVSVIKATYTGASLQLLCEADGHRLMVTLPERTEGIEVGKFMTLSYDPNSVHIMEA